MSGRGCGDGEGRGRYSTGRRSMGSRGLFSDLRRLILELYRTGYSIDQIIWYLTTGELGPRPEEPDRPDRPEEPEPTVKGVDLQVASNTQAHHTDEYDIVDEEEPDPALVVRRGQPFQIQVLLSKALSNDQDLRLVFEIGDTPSEAKRTRADFLLSDKEEEEEWGAKLVKKSGNSVEVDIVTPSDCIVGKWNFRVELVKKGTRERISHYTHEKPIYVLFNPWCPKDVVYNENEEELEEYVLADSGCIFVGSSYYNEPRSWNFGQFSGKVLDCTIYLLDTSDLNMQVRGDPIKVVRKLSAMVNSSDDRGVLTGNWSGNYTGGADPTSWTGSAKILEQYYETKSPVRYGQCWVFSGVLTTVCRALGIPCRSVTNFNSAHDTDSSVTIDEFYDKDGERMRSSDSVWNFHVWNDAWMRRDDLPDGYGGWQACDATPQEASDGVYQCGPCPLRAIREGELNLPHDCTFIFAEVNADKVKWVQQEDGRYKPVNHQTSVVGKNMSTRALRKDREATGDKRNVVTDLYKYPEGSREERAVVMKAYRMANPRGTRRGEAYDLGPRDVKIQLDFDAQCVVGQSFVARLLCTNTSSEERTIHGHGSISTMYYTGVVADRVARNEFKDCKLKPGASLPLEVTVTPEEYRRHLKDGCFLFFTMVAIVDETKQSIIESDSLSLIKPKLNIKAPAKGRVGEEFEVTITFTNSIPCTLTDCSLMVEGSGITKSKEYPQSDVPALGTFMTKLTLKPKKKGKREITFVFVAKELNNITGEHEISVEPRSA